ncbi:hypothetical protein AB0I49_37945 [Streptomyces sp. NPDC050617]|uniref:hypothetical protein n=1 Tax=Streptomyces sp. NPDC050617 TaxID=3154628 RepID=UPI0034253F90
MLPESTCGPFAHPPRGLLRVEHADFPVYAVRGRDPQGVAVVGESESQDAALADLEECARGAGRGGFPDPYGIVWGSDRDERAVGGEGDGRQLVSAVVVRRFEDGDPALA